MYINLARFNSADKYLETVYIYFYANIIVCPFEVGILVLYCAIKVCLNKLNRVINKYIGIVLSHSIRQ